MAGARGNCGEFGHTNTAMKLVFFDLDGTITRRDSLRGYLLGILRRRPSRVFRLPLFFPAALRFVFARCDRGELKASLARAIAGGLTRADINNWNAEFLPLLLAEGCISEALAAIAAHQAAGDHLVLMSASVDLYVPEIARSLGFHAAHCTQLSWDGNEFAGQLKSPNMRDLEKLRCVEQLRRSFPGLQTLAYGNSAPDMPHLRAVDHGVLVNGNATLHAAAMAAGIECVTWT